MPDSHRSELPITEKFIFLDHAAVAPMSGRAIGAVRRFIDESLSLGTRRYDVWGERLDKVRADAARLIGAKPDEIAFVPNTSTGLNCVAHGLSWYKGENIIVFDGEFPANVYTWKNLEENGIEIHTVPEKNNRFDISSISKLIHNNTKLLSVSSVEFRTGYRNDLDAIGDLCKTEGIFFCVDAIQSLGAFPMDVKKSGIDFLAADGHKWLLGPEGAGILYVSENFKDRIKPKFVGWNSVKNPLDFLPYHFEIRNDASRFEPGSLNLMEIFAMGESISLLLEVGIEAVAAKILALTDRLAAGLIARGWEIISPRETQSEKSGIVSFKGKEDSKKIFAKLAADGIIISRRGELLRASPHFYNTESEIDALLDKLGENTI